MENELTQQPGNATPPGDGFSDDLRGFGPVGVIAIIIILLNGNVNIGTIALPIAAILVLVWVKLSHTSWSAIGYSRPKSWMATLTIGLLFGIAFKLLMKAVVMPVLGAPAINQAYHYLSGNRALLPAAIWAMLNAGFSEETVFRGYMFERFGKLLGHRTWAKISIVLFTSIWFGLEHYSVQGVGGVEQSTIMGIVFGTIVMRTGKIWVAMIAHATFDLVSLAMVYLNMETAVAHLLFK